MGCRLVADAEPKCRDAFKRLAGSRVVHWCRQLVHARRDWSAFGKAGQGGRWSAGDVRRAAGVCVNARWSARSRRTDVEARGQGRTAHRPAGRPGRSRPHAAGRVQVYGLVDVHLCRVQRGARAYVRRRQVGEGMGHGRCPARRSCRCVWVMVDVGTATYTGDLCTNPLDYWNGSGDIGIELSVVLVGTTVLGTA